MKEQIEALLHTAPFEPFAIEVAEDLAWSIPTPDHAMATKFALVIEDDKGLAHLVSYNHIRQIVHKVIH